MSHSLGVRPLGSHPGCKDSCGLHCAEMGTGESKAPKANLACFVRAHWDGPGPWWITEAITEALPEVSVCRPHAVLGESPRGQDVVEPT